MATRREGRRAHPLSGGLTGPPYRGCKGRERPLTMLRIPTRRGGERFNYQRIGPQPSGELGRPFPMARISVSSEVAIIIGNLPTTTDEHGDSCVYKASLVGQLARLLEANEPGFNRRRFINACFGLRVLERELNRADLADWPGFGQPMN